jgi:hypothetical protein
MISTLCIPAIHRATQSSSSFVEEGAGEREKDCNEKRRKKWYRL